MNTKTSLILVVGIIVCLIVVLLALVYIRVRKNMLLRKKHDLEVFFHAIRLLSKKHVEVEKVLNGNIPEFSSGEKLSVLIKRMKIEKIKVLKLLKMPLLGEIPAETMESYYLICSNCKEKYCKECYLRSQSQPQSS